MVLSKLHVSGNRVLNDNNQDVTRTLRGINIQAGGTPCWMGDYFVNEQQFHYLKRLGVKIIRLHLEVDWIDWEGNSLGAREKMDNMISWAEKNGIYVILDYLTQTHIYMIDWTEADYDHWVDLWSSNVTYGVAKRYKNKTNVLFDLMNEPCRWLFPIHQTKCQECIDAIRLEIPDAVCIVEYTSEWWSDTWGLWFEQTYPINRSNVIFSIHSYVSYVPDPDRYGYYDAWGGWQDPTLYRAHLINIGARWCLDNGRAVQVGECGVDNFDPNAQASRRHQYDVLLEDGYSGWTTYAWLTGNYGLAMLSDLYGRVSREGSVWKSYLQPKRRKRFE